MLVVNTIQYYLLEDKHTYTKNKIENCGKLNYDYIAHSDAF